MWRTESAPPPCVLIVDDHESVRLALGRALEQRGWKVELAANGREAMNCLRRCTINVVLADLKMPGMDGITLLKSVKAVSPTTEVVMITAYGTVERAVEAMKLGAVDFLVKPFRRAAVIEALERALARQCGSVRADEASTLCPEIVGNSRAMRDIVHFITRIAPSHATVLVTGESGTGKELVADAIHRLSRRSNGPLVKVSCAALPETLLEAELFGHERGAFTGAIESRKGRFEVADGGTIFLDEIAQFSPAMQAKLLRVLQDGRFERVGSSETRTVDVRVIAATNVDLREAVAKGTFRDDLYYRLNVVAIHMPALRERQEDIPLVAECFLRRHCARNGKAILGITREALEALQQYEWPGNVRELENVIERAVVLADGDRIGLEDLPEQITHSANHPHQVCIPIGMPIREAQKRLIEAALRRTGGDKSAAAGLLGITRRTIYRHLDPGEERRATDEDK